MGEEESIGAGSAFSGSFDGSKLDRALQQARKAIIEFGKQVRQLAAIITEVGSNAMLDFGDQALSLGAKVADVSKRVIKDFVGKTIEVADALIGTAKRGLTYFGEKVSEVGSKVWEVGRKGFSTLCSKAREVGGRVVELGGRIRDRLGAALTDFVKNKVPAVLGRLKTLGSGFANLAGNVAQAGKAISKRLLSAATSFVEVGRGLAKMSAGTGVSVEALSELTFAAGKCGVSTESLQGGLQSMRQVLADAGSSGVAAGEALSAMGLSLSELEALSPDEQFGLLADRISSLADPADQAAMAMAIFGDQGTALLPMLQQGADGIDACRDQARQLGLTMSGESAAAAVVLGDAMETLSQVFQATMIKVGAAVAPVFQDLIERITGILSWLGDWVERNSDFVASAFKVVLAVTGIAVAVGKLGTAITVIKGAVAAIGVVLGALMTPVGLIVGAIAGIGLALLYVGLEGDTFGEKLSSLGNMIAPAVEWLTEFIKGAWNSVVEFLAPVAAALKDVLTEAWNLVAEYVWPLVDELVVNIQMAWESLLEQLQPVVEYIRDMIVEAWQWLEPRVRPVLDWLQNAVSEAFSAISFAVKNWQLLIKLAFVNAAYNIVKFAGEIGHFFTKVIPAYLSWFRDNWKDIFQTIWNGIKSFAGNVWKNVSNLWNSLGGLFRGEGWNFKWTGLLEGFESTIKEMPAIAEREIGNMEADLGGQLGDLMAEVASQRESHERDREERLARRRAQGAAEDAVEAVEDIAAEVEVKGISEGLEAALKGVGESRPDDEVVPPVPPKIDGAEAVRHAEQLAYASRGTFNSLAIGGLSNGGVTERMTKATEATAKNTHDLAMEAKVGGLKFT